jgi:hypothetical protein
MFLLSQKIINLLKNCFNLGAFFRVSPYQWDEKRDRLVLTTEKHRMHGRVFSWDSVKYLQFIHLIFILVRLWQSISGRRHYFAFYVTQSTYALLFLLASLIQALLIQNKTEILVFFNRFIRFSQYIERKLWSTNSLDTI